MRMIMRTIAVSGLILSMTACTLKQQYEPAVPAERFVMENTPLVPITPPGDPEEKPKRTEQAALGIPSFDEWNKLERQPQPVPRKGKGRRSTTNLRALQEEAIIRPGRRYMTPGSGAQIRFPYHYGKIYEVPTAPHSPTYLLLPPGERLAAPLAINDETWGARYVEQGEGKHRQEVVVLRPFEAPQTVTSGLVFRSGMLMFCRFVATEHTAAVSVTWEMPQALQVKDDTPPGQQPPKIDASRIYTAYQVTPLSKTVPPWLPQSIFDDGNKTLIKFTEALTYTRAPMVTGVTQNGTTALVQSYLYSVPGEPAKGAWLLINGLWPALELRDSAGLALRIVRQPVSGSREWRQSHAH